MAVGCPRQGRSGGLRLPAITLPLTSPRPSPDGYEGMTNGQYDVLTSPWEKFFFFLPLAHAESVDEALASPSAEWASGTIIDLNGASYLRT